MDFHFYSIEEQNKITEVGKEMLTKYINSFSRITKENKRISAALEDNPRDEAVLTRYFDMLIYG